jgi:hypothetical protein
LHLGPMPRPASVPALADGLSPFLHGYSLAAMVRERAGLGPALPMQSVAAVAQKVAGRSFRPSEQNHVPGHGVRAVVGWTAGGAIVIAGPRPQRTDAERFLDARGLFHALFTCDRSERLVTRAYTWDQQASRAFAAELLAPRAALVARAPQQADRATVDQLAQEFAASTKVIENQLENAGVVLVDE